MSVFTAKSQRTVKQYFSDSSGTYQVDKLFEWINKHPEKHKSLPIVHLLEYVVHDTWNHFETLKKTNFRVIFDDKDHYQRMIKADLSYPIVITNFNRLIDGVHRIFRAIFQKQDHIKAVFIDQEKLYSVRLCQEHKSKPSQVDDLPIEDYYLELPVKSLPDNPTERRDKVEDYFPDHLPTATATSTGFEICLERPSSPYGCYSHDKNLSVGLEWWGKKTRVRDICAEHRLLNRGILALEEQWIPLSWAKTFQTLGKLPEEVVLLHLDDHQDMMTPRVGKRLDGEMVDYITGNHIDFLNPESIASAIRSGAIGKGSILTPLIWSIPKIHIRHLSFRPHPNTTYRVDKVTSSDGILFKSNNRIGLQFSDTSWESLHNQSNYVVTDNFDTWLDKIPSKIPILLHFDLDYFNNRFDGNSNWKGSPDTRSHNPRFNQQLLYLKQVFHGIKKNNLSGRIIDTSIGISPGFYPAEFWQPMVKSINQELTNLGINLTKGDQMITRITRSITKKEEIKLKKQKAPKSERNEEKITANSKRTIAKSSLHYSSSSVPKKAKRHKGSKIERASTRFVSENSVSVEKMASKKFEGWKVRLDTAPCGFVKFHPKIDKFFKSHVTVDFSIPIPKRGKHIGRFALIKAINSSVHSLFVGHLRKSNIASKKVLTVVGFKECKYPGSNQLCMVLKK